MQQALNNTTARILAQHCAPPGVPNAACVSVCAYMLRHPRPNGAMYSKPLEVVAWEADKARKEAELTEATHEKLHHCRVGIT